MFFLFSFLLKCFAFAKPASLLEEQRYGVDFDPDLPAKLAMAESDFFLKVLGFPPDFLRVSACFSLLFPLEMFYICQASLPVGGADVLS